MVGRPIVACRNVDTRDERTVDFNRLFPFVPLIDSMTYKQEPLAWSQFNLWHGGCICPLWKLKTQKRVGAERENEVQLSFSLQLAQLPAKG